MNGSAWASPRTSIPLRTTTPRCCVFPRKTLLDSGPSSVCLDLRALNAVLPPRQAVLPTVEEIFERVEGFAVASTMDLTSAFFQMPVDEKSQPLLTFRWKQYTRCFTRGIFGLKDVSGVGISFGADRIYLVMEELDLFPENATAGLDLLFVAFDEAAHFYAYKCLQQIRTAGIHAELYPEPAKMKKQMKYADARKVPFVVVIGSDEMETGKLTFKNMKTGKQEALALTEIINQLK